MVPGISVVFSGGSCWRRSGREGDVLGLGEGLTIGTPLETLGVGKCRSGGLRCAGSGYLELVFCYIEIGVDNGFHARVALLAFSLSPWPWALNLSRPTHVCRLPSL